MNSDQLSALLEAQQQVIEQIALGTDLYSCLNIICECIEKIIDPSHAKSSILILEGNQLRHGAAPQIPQAYCDAIDGVVIGERVGSCGTAAYIQKQVIVNDIATNPLWENYKSLALENELQACWSTPIFSSKKEVLGSFAIYYSHIMSPSPWHLDLIDRFTHLSGLAIEKSQAYYREQALSTQLRQTNEKLNAFTNVIPDLGIIIDETGRYVDIYGANDQLQRDAKEKLTGKKVSDLFPAADAQGIMSVIDKTFASKQVQLYEYELRLPEGLRVFEARTSIINQYLPDTPNKNHLLWMARDITERKHAERQIKQLAFFDPLTDLPNRRLLADRLQIMIDKSIRHDLFGALLFLDLDDFKRINDSLGHSIGDQLLLEVANRLKVALRNVDTIARIGGDEFVIIPEHLDNHITTTENKSVNVAKKLLNCFTQPFKIGCSEYKISCSIGISLIKGIDLTAEDVLKRADTAMYRAKKLGGNQFSFYDPSLQHEIDLRLQLESEIISSVENNQFKAYFQPQLDSKGKVIGAEALIRWSHPEKGIISPVQFIPIAEQSGLIHLLQNIVLTDACNLIQQLNESQTLDDSFSIAINISSCQFKTDSLDNDIINIIKPFKLPAERFKLEITESMLIDNIDNTVAQMTRLKNKGFRFSIDDFGTGYSSLAYLHTFPIDELKIDKSFIDKLNETNGETAIVDAIISLSNHLGFNVIAEGVETQEQADVLSLRKIKGMQGYLFARPMPPADFIDWLNQKTIQEKQHENV